MENDKRILKINAKNRIRVILIIACCIIFLFSSIQISIRLFAYSKDNSQYEKIRAIVGDKDQFSTNVSTDVTYKKDESETIKISYSIFNGDVSQLNTEGILKYYEKLKKQNKDIIGWIRIPGYKKEIDYPVMQAVDNSFYLNKDFYKNFSHAGSIFIDAENQIKNADRHIVIYGHSMFDMSMFGNLRDYPGNKEEYTKKTKIFLDFMNTRLEYEVFSTYYVEASFNYRQLHFSKDEEYKTFLNKIQKKSVYDYGVTLSPMDKIITLSTCNGDIMSNGRSVVHARLISQILYDGLGVKKLVKADSAETKEVISANVYLEKLSLQYNLAKIRVNAPIVDISEGDSNNENQSIKNESTLNADTEDENNINTQNNEAENTNNGATENAKNKEVKTTEIKDSKKSKPLKDKIIDVKLIPEFYTAKSEYTAILPIGVEEIILAPKVGDLQAKVSIFINDKEAKLPTLKLVEGNNTIKVKVTSRDSQFEKVYIIHIEREPALK